MIKALKEEMRQKLLTQYSGILYRESIDKSELEVTLKSILDEVIHHQRLSIADAEKKKVLTEMVDELVGFGPIEVIMKDPEVTEVMINGPKKVYIEKKGKKTLSHIKFDDEQQLRCLIYKLLAPTRLRMICSGLRLGEA